MFADETGPSTLEEADQALATVSVEAPAEPEKGPTADQPRDDEGRFAKAPAAETPAEEPVPTPESPSDTEPTTDVTPEEPEVPFTFMGDGQEVAIPGSDVGSDGVFIPKESIPELKQLLAEGRAWRGSASQRLGQAAQQVQEANQRVEAAEAKSQHVLAHLEGLIEQSQQAIRSGDFQTLMQSPLGQWLYDVGINWPVLKAQAGAKAVEMQNAAERRQLEMYRQREAEAQLAPIKQQTLQRAVQHYATQAGLDQRVQAEVLRTLSDPTMDSVVFPLAQYDDPATGIRRGERVISFAVVQQAIALARAGRGVQTPQTPAVPIVKPKVPPTVGRGTGSPQPKRKWQDLKTREEADDFLLNGDLDEVES